MKSLRTSVKDYLTIRRALGFKLIGYETWLYDFVNFLKKHHSRKITSKSIVKWARQNPSTTTGYQALRFRAIRGFARYYSTIDPRTEVPPSGLISGGRSRSRFYHYSDDEIHRLLVETLKPRQGRTSISRWTYYALFGLLIVTGMRIGEALKLDLSDVDLEQGILAIRNSKFGKSRLVPIHRSTRTALKKYLKRRNEYFKGRIITPFFASRHGTRMSYSNTRTSFVTMSKKIGLRGSKDLRGPRIHDFRHRAAAQVMLRCYSSGDDPERRLAALSTYLGHVNLKYTYWYLHQNPAFMKQAVTRLERYWKHSS